MANKQIIKDFIQSELVKERGRFSLEDNDNLIERGVIDSLGIMKLLAYLEETFSISISDEELIPDNFETIDAISAFVVSKQR
ncbi:MAG: acyl carrier protein [Syntrophobacteraceae bacterium]|jgi:acyl carrier protein